MPSRDQASGLMYTGLGQQPPTLKQVNPDGSVTYYFGPPATVVQQFPQAATAVPVPIEEQQAAVQAMQAAPARTATPTPTWLVPALIGGALFLLL